jgi:hypothetical protein
MEDLSPLESKEMQRSNRTSPKAETFETAIEPQSPIALSQGSALGGQQSSPIADMSAKSADLKPTPVLAATGSFATDRAIRSARMVRPRFHGTALAETSRSCGPRRTGMIFHPNARLRRLQRFLTEMPNAIELAVPAC